MAKKSCVRSIIRQVLGRFGFCELKKKYNRLSANGDWSLPRQGLWDSFNTGTFPKIFMIGKEIQYFWKYYGSLRPTVFLSYEREAYYSLDGSDFRVTFDENILYREEDLSLGSPIYGKALLGEDETLMEIKTSGGIPLWLSRVLTENKIFKTSFSKYGLAYKQMGGRQYG